MTKRFLAGFILLVSGFAFAQQGTSSPYSFYGLGEQRFKGTVEHRSMGGLSIFPDSIHINVQNPASYSSMKVTVFSGGGTASYGKLETETNSQKSQRAVLDYLLVALPMKKAGIAFGLMPYTSTGYKLVNNGMTDAGVESTTYYEGKGGLNRVFVGAGYELSKNFRLGVDVNYNFGTVETETRFLPFVQYGTREQNNATLNGMSFTAGLMYEGKINDKLRIYSGVTYVPETNMRVRADRFLSLIQSTGTGNDFSTVERDTLLNQSSDIKMPSRFSFGAGIGRPQKWMAGAEVTFSGTDAMQNRYVMRSDAQFENAVKYSVGGWYIPNYNSYSGYFKRVTYRFGARYEKTGLVLADKSITDAAGTFGMGFPVPGTVLSNINLGLEYGKRGTVYGGLVAENYFNVSIGFSLNDRWFLRTKYD